MLQLRYSRKKDPFQYATVIGDAASIRDLYWQLTHNYQPQDGTAIGEIKVLSIDGTDVTKDVLSNPFGCAPAMSTIEL